MEIKFEPTRSFCYKFARYVVLPEVQQMAEVAGGDEFKLSDLAQRVIDAKLTTEQQQTKVKKAQSDKVEPVHSIVKFFVGFMAKELDLFVRLGKGVYRAKSAEDISDEDLEESALEEGEEEASELDGWLYAFSFPALVRNDSPFPIKVGKTAGDVEARVMQQCKGSATFDNPKVLGAWKVKRVGPSELAVHNVLKARGRWRENIPGIEWFDTSVDEIRSIVEFITGAKVV